MPSAKSPTFKFFVGAVSLMVAAVIAGGIYVAGSPSTSRAKILDQRRADALSQVSSALDQFYATNFALPPSLDDLKNSQTTNYAVSSIVDPETQKPIVYHVIDAQTYELCTTFAFPSQDQLDGTGRAMVSKPMPAGAYPSDNMNWYVHGAGDVCQRANAAQRAPFQYCGTGIGMNVCPGGTTCTQLPGRSSGICVKTGKECAAAGCVDDQCTIDKGTPPTVSCNSPTATKPGMMPVKGAENCTLYEKADTNERACFGCANNICTKPGPGFVPYGRPSGTMGIPYACTATETGCALVQ